MLYVECIDCINFKFTTNSREYESTSSRLVAALSGGESWWSADIEWTAETAAVYNVKTVAALQMLYIAVVLHISELQLILKWSAWCAKFSCDRPIKNELLSNSSCVFLFSHQWGLHHIICINCWSFYCAEVVLFVLVRTTQIVVRYCTYCRDVSFMVCLFCVYLCSNLIVVLYKLCYCMFCYILCSFKWNVSSVLWHSLLVGHQRGHPTCKIPLISLHISGDLECE